MSSLFLNVLIVFTVDDIGEQGVPNVNDPIEKEMLTGGGEGGGGGGERGGKLRVDRREENQEVNTDRLHLPMME